MALLLTGKFLFPRPIEFEKSDVGKSQPSGSLGMQAVLYLIAVGLLAAGFVDFPLLSYHMAKREVFSSAIVPLLYSVAMGVDAAAAIFFGKLYDKLGIMSLMISSAVGAFATPFVFLSDARSFTIIGVSLWGISMGAQESVMKAVIAKMIPPERRGFAYGLLNSVFGISWFAGSFVMGLLYQNWLIIMVILSLSLQLASVLVMLLLKVRAEV
jgi:predicted MFS family arabinose efflux permease